MTDEQPPLYNIDPDRLRVELLIKDPYFTDVETGDVTPMTDWMEWKPVTLVPDKDQCEHDHTLCPDCADEWGTDYFMKIYVDDKLVWVTPDAPTEGN
jgi:hypothetical protein